MPGLFDMRHFFDDVLAGMPPTSRELLTASFLRDVRNDPHHPLHVYHSPVDEEVAFEEVLVSVDRLRRRGADVSVRRLPGLDHVNSWSGPCRGRRGTSARWTSDSYGSWDVGAVTVGVGVPASSASDSRCGLGRSSTTRRNTSGRL